jgi:hypothetical protein
LWEGFLYPAALPLAALPGVVQQRAVKAGEKTYPARIQHTPKEVLKSSLTFFFGFIWIFSVLSNKTVKS